MTSFRTRRYGSPDWTQLDIEGEMEEDIALALASLLGECSDQHVQIYTPAGWSDLAEIDLSFRPES